MRLILLLCAIAFATTLDAQPTTNYPPFFTNAQGVVTTNPLPPVPPPTPPTTPAPAPSIAATISSIIGALTSLAVGIQYLRKAIKDSWQRGGFGQLIAAISPEVNPTPGYVPAAVHPAEHSPVVVTPTKP